MKNRKMLVVAGAALLALVVVGLLSLRNDSSPVDAAPSPRQSATVATPTGRGQGPVSTVAVAAAPTNTAPAAALSPRGTKTVRVTANRTMTEVLQRALAEMGARVIAPVGPRAILVEATPEVCRRIARDSRFTTEDVLPAAKVQGILAGMCARNDEPTVTVTVVGLAAADRAALSAYVVAQGGTLLEGPQVPDTFYADMPTDLVASLAERGDVRWLEYHPQMKLLNDCSVVKAAANVETVRSKHILRGRGQLVSVYDSGFDTGDKDNCHLDFKGRVKAVVNEAYTKADYMGHGTHCAGTVLGDGARSDGKYQGAAPEATLLAQCAGDTSGSSSIYLPGTYTHIFASVLSYGGYIQSDSWGGGKFGVYDVMCQGLDQVIWDHPELLVVAAAGNEGDQGMGTVSSPACAKNALTVGNSYSTRNGSPEDLNDSSSRGPTLDGRIKPEITAPGTYKYSTLSSKSLKCKPISDNKYYTEMTGTSMATPLVAGSAALVRQWLVERRDYTNTLPSSALVKAIITGGGTMMTGSCSTDSLPQTIPNNYTGWGRLNLEETLYPTNGYAVKFADYIPFHDGVTETIDLTTTNAAPLDVQLCWIDCPADPSAAQTLINDLDLVVSNKTTGAVWYGNGIDGGDHTNTTESVRLPLAEAGDYAILVRGYAIMKNSDGGKGAAAVYIRGAFEDETKEDPLYVRNARSGERYETLEQALAEAQKNDTIELLQPLDLPKDLTITKSCTLTVTNADPTAAQLTRVDGASLTVANGAVLTLTNIVIVADDASTAVTVLSDGQLVLSGTVGVGTVEIANSSGLKFAAPLDLVGDMLSVDAPNGYEKDDAFGTYTGDLASASNAAARVINLRNGNLGGVAGGGTLTWGVVPCDPSIARCVVTVGGETTYCRTFEQALELALPKDATVTMKKPSTLSSSTELVHNLTLAGDGGSLSLGANAGFVIPTGTHLLITNTVVRGTGDAGNAANSQKNIGFSVTGGELVLEDGAVLTGFSSRNATHKDSAYYGGAVVVNPGTFTMRPGSCISNCVSHSQGGAVWLGGKNATANLIGGTITGCSADAAGGAVYAWGSASTGATVNVAGDFVAVDNKTGSASDSTAGNLYLMRMAPLKLAGALTGSVGVSFGTKSGVSDLNALEANFVALACELTPQALTNSAVCFANDINTNLVGGCVGGQIVWTVEEEDDGQCDKDHAGVRVKVAGESDYRYYSCINDAFDYVKTNATFEVKGFVSGDTDDLDCLTKDVTIDHDVRITSWEGFTYNESDIMILWRTYHAMYKVVAGGSLTLSNVKIVGACSWDDGDEDPWDDDPWCPFTPLFYEDTDPENPVEEPSIGYGLISVDGGSLTLENGARVGFVFGYASRASNAIAVFNGGTVTMKSGSRVSQVDNRYNDEYEVSCGGGILLDRSTGYFEGGAIYNCKAYRAGGLYVANESTAYVSGGIYIDDNESWKRQFEQGTNSDLSDNVVVSKNSKLVLAGPLESVSPWSEDPDDPDPGYIGVNESIAGDTNWFGYVSEDWNWDYDTLTNSAAYFRHDKRSNTYWEYPQITICGTAVTNWNERTQRWDARLVWEDSLSPAKGITIDGETYRGAIPADKTVAVPTAFSLGTTFDGNGKMALSLDGGVAGCWYTVYSTDDLAQPFTEEASIQLKEGETFSYEIDRSKTAKFYKVEAEEGLR